MVMGHKDFGLGICEFQDGARLPSWEKLCQGDCMP